LKRNKSYYRYQRNRAINRKFNILRKDWGTEETEKFYDKTNKGKLSKGKIHCSCWMCREKSYIELKHTDKKKILKCNQSLNDFHRED
jgi:hypothetical protein